MSIDASSFLTTPATETHKPAPTRHVDARQNPPEPEDQITSFLYDQPGVNLLSPFIGDEKNRYPWIITGSTTSEVDFLENLTMACGGLPYRIAFVVRCRLEKSLKDGAYTTVRVIERKFAEDGSPIYEGAFISLWKFLEEHEPDATWMSRTEWAALKKAIAPAMAIDKARELAETEARNVRNEQLAQAHAAKLNPQKFMADALAAGLAMAIRELKTEPAK